MAFGAPKSSAESGIPHPTDFSVNAEKDATATATAESAPAAATESVTEKPTESSESLFSKSYDRLLASKSKLGGLRSGAMNLLKRVPQAAGAFGKLLEKGILKTGEAAGKAGEAIFDGAGEVLTAGSMKIDEAGKFLATKSEQLSAYMGTKAEAIASTTMNTAKEAHEKIDTAMNAIVEWGVKAQIAHERARQVRMAQFRLKRDLLVLSFLMKMMQDPGSQDPRSRDVLVQRQLAATPKLLFIENITSKTFFENGVTAKGEPEHVEAVAEVAPAVSEQPPAPEEVPVSAAAEVSDETLAAAIPSFQAPAEEIPVAPSAPKVLQDEEIERAFAAGQRANDNQEGSTTSPVAERAAA